MSSLPAFYPGETYTFNITLKINGSPQDVTGDTVTFRMKRARSDPDGFAALTKAADVTTSGASGIARFTLSSTNTKGLAARNYVADIEWVTSGGAEYIAYDQEKLTVKERVSAPPA